MVHVENLRLDHENPRLSTSGQGTTQEALLKEVYRRYNVDQLIVSLAQNGYFSEEPLIAVERKDEATGPGLFGEGVFTVVEGNRRLAALKVLLFEAGRKAAEAKNVPTPSPVALEKLNPVPVKVYPSRAEIVAYLGVRHIVGVKPWDALAKARYIDELARSGYTIAQIKETVGIRRSDVVQRWLLTLYVLDQANRIADEPWTPDEGDFKFSLLYTALGYQNVRQYLGIEADILGSPRRDPVPERSEGKLLEHMRDLYGTQSRPDLRKIRESREISQLAAVYATAEALDALRAGAHLSEAYRKSEGEAAELVELVRGADYQLGQANAIAPHHRKNPEARRFAKRCLDSAEVLYKTLED